MGEDEDLENIYYDDSPDESEADPIDADLENADWPKRTRDRLIDYLDAKAAMPLRPPFIYGGSWFIWFDYETMDWASDVDDSPVGVLRENFGREVIDKYIESGATRWDLYADAVAYLGKWGIKASVESNN